MTAARPDMDEDLIDRVALTPGALRAWWCRHGGLDGVVRVGGAVAVVGTIECLAGYFLWTGMTLQVEVPDAIGWTLQVGLAGGSAVGTRAFHRGLAEDKWWGLAASVLAAVCLVVDASLFALLAHDQIDVPAGSLAVVALVQCLVVGYLTVHTLMAAPRGAVERPAARDEPDSEVADAADEKGADPPPADPETEPLPPPPSGDDAEEEEEASDASGETEDRDEDNRSGDERRPVDHRLIRWRDLTKPQAQAEARRLTAAGHRVTQNRKTLEQLRRDIRDARREAGEAA